MKNILFTLTLLVSFSSLSQANWKLQDYPQWDYTNFRQNQLFNQLFSTSDPDYLLLDAAVFYLTNEERAKLGIPILPYHKLLEVAAYNHSMKMATTGFFSHRNPNDTSRTRTGDRGKLAGVSNPKFAENIAMNYLRDNATYLQVATTLIEQWMNSAGHRSNILSSKAKQMGAGTYYKNGQIYGTQVFQWFYFVDENSKGKDQLPTQK